MVGQAVGHQIRLGAEESMSATSTARFSNEAVQIQFRAGKFWFRTKFRCDRSFFRLTVRNFYAIISIKEPQTSRGLERRDFFTGERAA